MASIGLPRALECLVHTLTSLLGLVNLQKTPGKPSAQADTTHVHYFMISLATDLIHLTFLSV